VRIDGCLMNANEARMSLYSRNSSLQLSLLSINRFYTCVIHNKLHDAVKVGLETINSEITYIISECISKM